MKHIINYIIQKKSNNRKTNIKNQKMWIKTTATKKSEKNLPQ